MQSFAGSIFSSGKWHGHCGSLWRACFARWKINPLGLRRIDHASYEVEPHQGNKTQVVSDGNHRRVEVWGPA
jgi:hypothetical protein